MASLSNVDCISYINFYFQEDMIQFLKKFSKEGKYEDFSSYFAEVGAFEEKYEEIE